MIRGMLSTLLVLALALFNFSATTQAAQLDLPALTDGSLGTLPAKMLVLDGVINQQNATGRSEHVLGLKPPPANGDHRAQNGAIMGATLGAGFIGGLAKMDKGKTQYICNAIVKAASAAVSTSTGQLITQEYPPKDKEGQPGQEEQDPTGPAMVVPFYGGMVSGGVAAALSETICERILGPKEWSKKLTDNGLLKKKFFKKGAEALNRLFKERSDDVRQSALRSSGVGSCDEASFNNALSTITSQATSLPPATAAERLQTDIIRDVATIADQIAQGNGGSVMQALNAVNQIQALTGQLNAGVPEKVFEKFALQLYGRNQMASKFSLGSKSSQISKAIEGLLTDIDKSPDLCGIGDKLRKALPELLQEPHFPVKGGGQARMPSMPSGTVCTCSNPNNPPSNPISEPISNPISNPNPNPNSKPVSKPINHPNTGPKPKPKPKKPKVPAPVPVPVPARRPKKESTGHKILCFFIGCRKVEVDVDVYCVEYPDKCE
jgi:hypothetical protein